MNANVGFVVVAVGIVIAVFCFTWLHSLILIYWPDNQEVAKVCIINVNSVITHKVA